MRRQFAVGVLVAACAAVPAVVSAQSTTPAWEIEGHGGGVATGALTSATKTSPPLGTAILTSSPTFPGRQAPSWFFGDGASQLNGAVTALGLPASLTPLDSAFRSLGTGAATGGARLTRRLTTSFGLEVSVDVIAGSSSGASSLKSAAQSASNSFQPTFAGLLTTGPFNGVSVDASNAVGGGAGLDLATTAALRWRLAPQATWSPYVTVGGGMLTRAGSLEAATLDGHYQFLIANSVPINEHDHVVLAYQKKTAPVVVAGFGVSHAMGRTWAINVDARVFIGSADSELRVSASPTSLGGTPAGSIELDSVPALQFSNNPSTGRLSTLGGSLSGFTVVSGGVSARTLVTIGLARRF